MDVVTLSNWSRIVTAGVKATFASAFGGCTVKASLAGGPGLMLNVLLVALVRPVERALKA